MGKTDMAHLGRILGLVSGILSIIGGIFLAGFSIVLFAFPGTMEETAWLPVFYMLFGVWMTITGTFMIVGSHWMKNKETLYKGALTLLIASVLAGVKLIGITGGILGLVESSKKKGKK